MTGPFVVLGAGGHARVLLDGMRRKPVGFLDPDRSKHGKKWAGVPVLGGEELLPALRRKGVRCFILGLGGTGDNGPRQRAFEAAVAAGFSPGEVRHPSAFVSRSARLGKGCQVLPRAVVNAGAVLGDNVLINTRAVVEHDCRVASHAHVSTGAVLCGGVTVGEGAHVGAGAVVRQGAKIGARAVVAMGAVVVKDVPAGVVVAGVPAKPLKRKKT